MLVDESVFSRVARRSASRRSVTTNDDSSKLESSKAWTELEANSYSTASPPR